MPLVELVQASPHLGSDAVGLLEPGVAVTRRTSPGGAGPKPVAAQLERFRHRLELDGQRVTHAQAAAHVSPAPPAPVARAAHGGG